MAVLPPRRGVLEQLVRAVNESGRARVPVTVSAAGCKSAGEREARDRSLSRAG